MVAICINCICAIHAGGRFFHFGDVWNVFNIKPVQRNGIQNLRIVPYLYFGIGGVMMHPRVEYYGPTDEYDDHVVVHEWAHYFEANFSRSDSIGGDHASDNVLDIRLAFGEGFGNAYSAMASA